MHLTCFKAFSVWLAETFLSLCVLVLLFEILKDKFTGCADIAKVLNFPPIQWLEIVSKAINRQNDVRFRRRAIRVFDVQEELRYEAIQKGACDIGARGSFLVQPKNPDLYSSNRPFLHRIRALSSATIAIEHF